ncbi:MAG: energy-coupling factor ABC transporter permease [Trichodesmium sp. St15_bin1_1]|nr:energy-coupling factor ABC transporter permease [Trichodesmium sp. St15_bin1_1]
MEQKAIYGLMISHIPLMGIEGILTAMIISFMHRVMPELLPS